jgi:hypothetical protein
LGALAAECAGRGTAVHDYSYANELVMQARGRPDLFDAAKRRPEKAKINCEAAMQVMKHHIEHSTFIPPDEVGT